MPIQTCVQTIPVQRFQKAPNLILHDDPVVSHIPVIGQDEDRNVWGDLLDLFLYVVVGPGIG